MIHARSSMMGELNAHELAHNLRLKHTSSGLMAPMLDGGTSLTATQADTIMASPLVQNVDGVHFISVSPIAMVSSVPEPARLLYCA